MRKCFRGIKAVLSIAVAFAMIMTMVLCTAVVKAGNEETKVTATIKKIMDFSENAKSWPYSNTIAVTTPGVLYFIESSGTINGRSNEYGIDWISCGNPEYINGEFLYGYSSNKENKYHMILNPNGAPYGNIDGFCLCGFVGNATDGSYWRVDDSGTVHIENKDGSSLFTVDVSTEPEISDISRLGDYYIVKMAGNKVKVYNSWGIEHTPNLQKRANAELLNLRCLLKKNTVCFSLEYSYGMNPDADRYYFDRNLSSSTEAAYNADSETDMKIKDYKGYKHNYEGAIANKAPTGFNYCAETYINGDWYGIATQSKDGMQIGVLYDTDGNILVSGEDFGSTPLAGPFFIKNTNGHISLCVVNIIKPTEPENDSTPAVQGPSKEAGSIESISNDAKILDEKGNEVSADRAVIEAVEAIQAVVENAKKVLEEKGIVIPSNAHVDFFEVDLKDVEGNVLKLADGSVRFFVPVKDEYDPGKYILKAYHVLPDNTCEEVSVEWVDGKPCVTATSFSPYVIVYEPIPVKSPATGDNANMLFMVLMLASAIIAGTILIHFIHLNRLKR